MWDSHPTVLLFASLFFFRYGLIYSEGMIEQKNKPSLLLSEQLSSKELTLAFVERWFTRDLIEKNAGHWSNDDLVTVGEALATFDQIYPRRSHGPTFSPLNLGDIFWLNDNLRQFGTPKRLSWSEPEPENVVYPTLPISAKDLLSRMHGWFSLHSLYVPVGTSVSITADDLLVTTPVAQVDAHIREAQERLDEYENKGTVGYYYRMYHPHAPPKTLKVGSKMFYVDRRAIRGFAVVTELTVDPHGGELIARMQADTWRWIAPIPVSYEQQKPPQGFAYAAKHPYLAGVQSVAVIGDWLAPMPEN